VRDKDDVTRVTEISLPHVWAVPVVRLT